MSQKDPQSKILTIDEQIKLLQEKKKREIKKVENSTGKRFLDTFDMHNAPVSEIHSLIDTLKEFYEKDLSDNINIESQSENAIQS